MNKNIKIITYQNFPYGGAPANFVRYFSLALEKVGNNVEVIVPTGLSYRNERKSKISRSGRINSIKYNFIGFINNPDSFFFKVLSSLIAFFYTPLYLLCSFIKLKYEILICYNVHFSRTFFLYSVSKILKVKFILIIPEFYEKPKNKIQLIKWFDFYIGLKFLTKYADAHIPLSHYMRDYLENKLKIRKPIYILPNIMNPDDFSIQTKKPFIEGKHTIGYCGTPTRKDGVLDLIKCFSILHYKYPNTHLLIIGDQINNYSLIPSLIEYTKDLKIEENITFTGLVSFEKIPMLLNSCQILTLTRPSGIFAQAGFPTKLGEYFACKIPVLVTKVGDIPYYFENKKHVVLAEPENIDSMLEGFEILLSNHFDSHSMVEEAFNWMQENLNYKNISIKLSEFVTNI